MKVTIIAEAGVNHLEVPAGLVDFLLEQVWEGLIFIETVPGRNAVAQHDHSFWQRV